MAQSPEQLSLFGRKGGIYAIPPAAPFFDTLARAILSGDLPRPGRDISKTERPKCRPGRPQAEPGPTRISASNLPGIEASGSRLFGRDDAVLDRIAEVSTRATLDEAKLAHTLIYLPSRAACRELKAAFLRASPDKAAMPRLYTLGAEPVDALRILAPAEDAEFDMEAGAPPAIGALERRLVLTRLIHAWAERVRRGQVAGDQWMRVAQTPAEAAELALSLMRLMDEADAREVDLLQLRALRPDRFAAHQQLSLDFLNIVLEAWPDYMAQAGRLSPMRRRNEALAREAARLDAGDREQPVIMAAPFDGTPAMAALLRAVHDMPQGAIVLPGVDLALDDAGWAAVAGHADHAQFSTAQALRLLGASRADVATLGGGGATRSAHVVRMGFLSEALRPSGTVAAWPRYIATANSDGISSAFAEVSRVTVPTESEEAALIAMILREASETPGKTVNLITPDKTLTRRVRAELGRWGLKLQDGAGLPLASTLHGAFCQLVAEAGAGASHLTLLALLKHPLMRLGHNEAQANAAARLVELAAIRQPWQGSGPAALARSLEAARKSGYQHPALARLSEEEWELAAATIERLEAALKPLTKLTKSKAWLFGRLAEATRQAIEALAQGQDGATAYGLGSDGAAMAAFMAALCADSSGQMLALKSFPAVLRSLMRHETCADPAPEHPWLRILTPAEARFTSADMTILAGCNEGVWPEPPNSGPWLNASARAALGLDAAERSIGIAANDFWQHMAAREVVLTRSLKTAGAPTVPSRWLLRIEALLTGLSIPDALEPKRPWLHWAAERQRVKAQPWVKPPAPCPPLAARPRQLSTSAIAKLMANPYAIYAEHILGLKPLDRLESEPGGGERGRIVHDTLHRFAQRFPDRVPDDCAAQLLALFDSSAGSYGDHAHVAAFWRYRLQRFASWFAQTEPARRDGAQIHARVRGELTLEAPAGPFTITSTADRIDVHADGGLAIYDYKSGALPKETDILSFTAPQLPLQALIAGEGRFKGVDGKRVAKLAYISAKGGQSGGEEAVFKQDPAALAQSARAGLNDLIARFDDPATPYTAMRRGGFKNGYRFDDYAHLARVEAWTGTGEEG